MSKKVVLRYTFGLASLTLVLFFLIGLAQKIESKVKSERQTPSETRTPERPDLVVFAGKKEIEEMKEMEEMAIFKAIDAKWKEINKATAYEKAGNYELAEQAYKKAIEVAPGLSNEWVPREGLADLYEKTHQYEKAIEQLDWLIQGKPRQDVLDEFLLRKQKLEQLVKEGEK